MPRFPDDRALYGSVGRLIRDALVDSSAGGRLRRIDAAVQFRFRDPDSVVTALLRGSKGQVDFGPSRLRPDVTLAMDADTAHGWLLGEVNPTTALGDGRMKTRGPSANVLAVLALIKVLAPRYQALVAEAGDELPESLDASLLPEPVRVAKAEAVAPAEAAPAASAEEPAAVEEQTAAVEEDVGAPAEEPEAAPAEEPAAVEEQTAAVEEEIPAPAEEPEAAPAEAEPAAAEEPEAAPAEAEVTVEEPEVVPEEG